MRRHYLLRPDPIVKQLFVYVMAVAAERFRVRVHAVCVMSNHVHVVATDSDGCLPRWLAFVFRILALCVKTLRAWDGPLWDAEQPSVVRLETSQAVIEKIAYVIANPASANLVRTAVEWPGLVSRPEQIGVARLSAARPSLYMNPKNKSWPEMAQLPLELPPAIAQEDASRFVRKILHEVKRLERISAARVRSGQRVLGADAARALDPFDRPASKEAIGRTLPTSAVGRNGGSMRRLVSEASRRFRLLYSKALAEWRAGVRSTVFPNGTWAMRVHHMVVVAPAPG
jgi:hypothetical protein